MLPLDFIDRLKAKAHPFLVRHQVENRASVAGNDYRFAAFHLASEFGQTVLCARIDTVFIPSM
jgi:hypothetical protein